MWWCQLTGTIPTQLWQATALRLLNLGSNSALVGPLAPELAQLTALTQVYLSESSLTGPIPSEMGQMTALVNVALDQNALTGTLPMELAQLTALTRFEVHTNPGLCGDLVSVGTLGTSYTAGVDATALGTACASPPPPFSPGECPRPRVWTSVVAHMHVQLSAFHPC